MTKTAIITGASSGIGKAMVTLFAANGYNILAVGRDEARTHSAIAGIQHSLAWVGDISSSGACDDIIKAAIEAFGGVDVLINNAGIIYRSDAANTSDQQWQDTITTNLSAPFYLSRAALPALKKSKGTIINIASDWGLQGGTDAVAYCASKGGLVLMTKAMALDHARDGVTINAICPGDVDTPMLEKEASQRNVDYEIAMVANNEDSPTGRVTQPAEVAALALFLASDMAKQITGSALPIDGGNTA